MNWVTIEYTHQSSNAHVRYTKPTSELKPYEWKVGFRPATELEIKAAQESRLQTQPSRWDWRTHPDVQYIMQWNPLKVTI